MELARRFSWRTNRTGTKIIAHRIGSSTTTNAQENEQASLQPSLNAPRASATLAVHPAPPRTCPIQLDCASARRLRRPSPCSAVATSHAPRSPVPGCRRRRWTSGGAQDHPLPDSVLHVRVRRWCLRSFAWLGKENMDIRGSTSPPPASALPVCSRLRSFARQLARRASPSRRR